MYNASTDKQSPPPDAGKYVRLGVIAIIVIAIFAIVIIPRIGWLDVNVVLAKFLIPSVCAEIIGLGLVVVKYLFSEPIRQGFDLLVKGTQYGHRPTECPEHGLGRGRESPSASS